MIADDGGEARAAGLPVDLCRTCTFRPWAQAGEVVAVTITVTRRNGSVTAHQANGLGDGRWATTSLLLRPGDRVAVPAGGVVDAHGEVNGQAVEVVVGPPRPPGQPAGG